MHACRSTLEDPTLGPEELPEGGSGKGRVETTFQLSGELFWDLDHGHARALQLAGPTGLTLIQTISSDFEGEPVEQTQTMVFDGQRSFTMTVERR